DRSRWAGSSHTGVAMLLFPTRDTVQRVLVGRPGQEGTGSIPRNLAQASPLCWLPAKAAVLAIGDRAGCACVDRPLALLAAARVLRAATLSPPRQSLEAVVDVRFGS